MVVMSKNIFDAMVTEGNIGCNIFHPWTNSCLKATGYITSQSFIGVNKFFFPIYLFQTLLNWKQIDKNYHKQLLRDYLRTLLYGNTFVMIFFCTNCISWYFTRKYKYYQITSSCGFFSGLSIYLESTINRNLNTLYFFNVGIEALVNNLEYFKYITRTRIKDTLFFMTCTSVLMYLFKTQNCKPYNHFWFYPPDINKKNSEELHKIKICNHEDTCFKYFWKGFLKYFGIGFALEIVKFLLSKFGLLIRKPSTIITMLFKKNNFMFGLVTAGYVGIYRILTCYLLKSDQINSKYHELIAGFISGSAYFIKPNLQFGITAFTTILQLLLQRTQRIIPISSHLTGLLFAILNAILLHNRFMFGTTCPNYTINMVNTCSNGVGDAIYNGMLREMSSFLAAKKNNVKYVYGKSL